MFNVSFMYLLTRVAFRFGPKRMFYQASESSIRCGVGVATPRSFLLCCGRSVSLASFYGAATADKVCVIEVSILVSHLFSSLNKQLLAMVAHIKYLDLDKENCATYSEPIISFIKNKLGFKGILFSDDLCMKALKGSYINRAKNAIKAGCDIVLHCEPNISNAAKSCDGAGYAPKTLMKKIKELKYLINYLP